MIEYGKNNRRFVFGNRCVSKTKETNMILESKNNKAVIHKTTLENKSEPWKFVRKTAPNRTRC